MGERFPIGGGRGRSMLLVVVVSVSVMVRMNRNGEWPLPPRRHHRLVFFSFLPSRRSSHIGLVCLQSLRSRLFDR